MSLAVSQTPVPDSPPTGKPGKTAAKGLADLVSGLSKKISGDHPSVGAHEKQPKLSFQAILEKLKVRGGDQAGAGVEEKAVLKKNAEKKSPPPTENSPKEKKIGVQEKKSDKEAAADAVPLAASLLVKPVEVPVKPKTEEPGSEKSLAEKNKAVKPAGARTDEGGRSGLAEAAQLGSEVRDLRTGGRKTEKTEEKRFQVVDRRTEAKEKAKAEKDQNLFQPVNAPVELQSAPKPTEAKTSDQVQVFFQAVGGKLTKESDLKTSNAPISPQDAQAFRTYMLEKGHAQLVEQARIILKDHNQGEIKLTLYPETLGKVKVALNLNDSHLAGQIFVENQTVKEIFQQNMDQLLQAFRDGGYQNLNIQVSVGNGNSSGNGQKSEKENLRVGDYVRQVASKAEGSDASAERIPGSHGERLVNLTA